MSKRKIRRQGGKLILKQGKTHQSAFRELVPESKLSHQEIANELAKIPSQRKVETVKIFNIIFIVCLSLVILLRIIGIIALGVLDNMGTGPLLLIILVTLIVPAVGIYGAINYKAEIYKSVGILLLIGIFRSVTNGDFAYVAKDTYTLIGYIPYFVAIALAFYIPTRLKTAFSIKVVTKEDGSKKKQIIFEEEPTEVSDSEVLDD